MKSKTKIIGILNITDDSFSDGGKYIQLTKSINHIKSMISNGCRIIDIGAESTKSGFKEVSIDKQLTRILPVMSEIKKIKDDIKITCVETADEVLKLALTKELKRVEWTEIENISKSEKDKSQASIQ